jgi:Dna[CI] antecedent, DciA
MYQVPAFRDGEKSGLVKRADVLLKPLVRNLGLDDAIRLAQIKSQWHTLFQKPIAYHMSPSSLSGSELLLNVDSPIWLQELKFYQEDIIKKLTLYHVRTVRFRLGRVYAIANQEGENEGLKGKPLTAHDQSFIEETVSNIEDEALKEVIKKAIAKAMTAGKRP